MTVNTRIIRMFLARHTVNYVPLANGLRIQVLSSMQELPRCQKHHFGAFISDQQILVVWDDEPKQLIDRAKILEGSLMEMIWATEEEAILDEKCTSPLVSTTEFADGTMTPTGLEEGTAGHMRPTNLSNPIMVGLTLTLLTAALGLGWRNLAQEVAIDGKYTRLALVVVTPCQVFISLFFMQIIIVNLSQMFGPVSHLTTNSKFFSGKASFVWNLRQRKTSENTQTAFSGTTSSDMVIHTAF